MKSLIKLKVLADRLEDKLQNKEPEKSAADGEFGGKGKFELPPTHKAAMQVTKGGSCCKNCKFVDVENHACLNEYYIQWNGGSGKLPNLPLDEICSDWWEGE